MLYNFRFSNFKSFRGEQSFSLERPKAAIKRQAETIPAKPELWVNLKTSTVAGIYGANAAGKSNFTDAIGFVSDFVRDSFRLDEGSEKYYFPFALDDDGKESPSKFAIDFVGTDEMRYLYSFEMSSQGVNSENLYKYNGTNRPSLLFSRSTRVNADGGRTQEFKYGTLFRGAKQIFEKSVRPNALAITVMAAAGSESVRPAYEFLAKRIWYYRAAGYHSELGTVAKNIKEGTPAGRALSSLMASAGVGIESVEASPHDGLPGGAEVPVEKREKAYHDLVAINLSLKNPEYDEERLEQETTALISKMAKEVKPYKLSFIHHGDGRDVPFPMKWESEGTLAALAFFSVAFRAMESRTLTVVDEIDTSLHPLYVQELVRLFEDPITNPWQSQIVFTTHDASLITKTGAEERVLDKDQVWFVEKDAVGASTLYPQTEFEGRYEENLGRNYLNGVYGATPSLSIHSYFAREIGILGGDHGDDETD